MSRLLVVLCLGLAACQPGIDPDATSQTATLTAVVAEEDECYLLATGSAGDLVLMGTPEACQEGEGLEGQVVTIYQKPTVVDVPLGDGSAEHEVELVVGVRPVE